MPHQLLTARNRARRKLSVARPRWRPALESLEPRIVLDSTVVFNEIMYNPSGDASDHPEWIELHNQMAIDMEISNWSIGGGIQFDFAEGTAIPGRGHLVIAADPAALESATGFTGALGPFTGQLSNAGEELRLLNNNGRRMNVVDYGDSGQWPVAPDGGGVTLTKLDENTNSELAENWTFSIQVGGTPGAANFPKPSQAPKIFEDLVTPGSSARVLVPGQQSDLEFAGRDWNDRQFDDAAAPGWFDRTSGIGFDASGTSPTGPLIDAGGDVESQMHNVNPSGFARIPFQVDDPADLDQLNLTIDYDDGYVAHLNGIEVARSNAPAGTLAFDATANDAIETPTNPLSTNLALWLDADDLDGDGIPEGNAEDGIIDGKVATWVDKAADNGTQNASQTNSGEQPVFSLGEQNNRPVVRFDGFDDFVKTTPFPSIIAQPISVFMVWQLDEGVTQAENNYIIFDGLSNSSRVLLVNEFLGGPAGGNLGFFTGNFVSSNYIPFGLNRGGVPIVSSHEYNSPDSVLRLDGEVVMSGKNTGTHNLDGVTLGGRFERCCGNDRLSMKGFIAEVLVYEGLLSPEDREAVEDYLQQKWQNVAGSTGHDELSLTSHLGDLVAGQNVLAIQGLNSAVDDDDFLIRPTITARRVPAPIPGDDTPNLVINEVASANDSQFFVEIRNLGPDPVDLDSLVLTLAGNAGGDYVFPSQTVVAGGIASVGAAQLPFSPVRGDKLFLYQPGKNELLDAREVTNRLRGRSEEHNGQWLYPDPDSATPGNPNSFAFNNEIVISEIQYHAAPDAGTNATPPTFDTTTYVPLGSEWRYNDTGEALPDDWHMSRHTVGGNWSEGQGLIGFETGPLPPPGIQTELADPLTVEPRIITYYFELDVSFTAEQLAKLGELQLRHVIDDGAVFYVNGSEFHRFNLPGGEITPSTTAFDGIANASLSEAITVPFNLLEEGDNLLSVELHQRSETSSDFVFGAELLSAELVDPGTPGTPFQDNTEEWIELYNRGSDQVSLTGWTIRNAIDFDFPTGTVINAGEFLVVANDQEQLLAKHPGINVIGNFSGTLSNSEDRILLRDAFRNPADQVNYFDGGRWTSFADAGGSTLELRDPDADNSIGDAWGASDETARRPWQTYTFRRVAGPDRGPIIWNELQLGMLEPGEILLDDISVVFDPDGFAAAELIQNRTFELDSIGGPADKWRIIGNHQGMVVEDPDEPGNQVLRLVADATARHEHDHAETTLGSNTSVVNGVEYEVSFRAKHVGGSDQLNARLYLSRVAATTRLEVSDISGSPGAPNSLWESNISETNIGPTYTDFRHLPVLPEPLDDVTVSVTAADPDNVAQMTVMWSVDNGPFNSVAMTLDTDGQYHGTIPGHTAGTVVQFYVEGQDGLGATSKFPVAGEDSRALFIVEDGKGTDNPVDTVRIVMTPDDADLVFEPTRTASNDLIGATVIINNRDVFYDVGARLKGTMSTRTGSGAGGAFPQNYRIQLHTDQRFRGVHNVIVLDGAGRSTLVADGQDEILARHLMNHAGGIPSLYDDLGFMVSPLGTEKTVMIQLARYSDLFFEERFGPDSGGTAYEYVVVDAMRQTVDGNPESLKVLRPGTFGVTNTLIGDLGNDKETYRHNFPIKSNRDRDDYGPFIEFAKSFSLSGAALDAASQEIMDIDNWARVFAAHALVLNDDVYSYTPTPQNIWFYAHPGTDKMMVLPWDMDSTFRGSVTRALIGGETLGTILKFPHNARLVYGHLRDMINTTYNEQYLGPWAEHLGSLVDQDYSPNVDRVQQRADFVMGQLATLAPQIPFEITSNGGIDFAVNDEFVDLEGQGWIDVREIRLADSNTEIGTPSGTLLPVTWLDDENWRISFPLATGANVISLEAFDHQGMFVGSDMITVTTTATNPVGESLRITEVNYNPHEPTDRELAIDPDLNNDDVEFLEVQNIGTTAINLLNVHFRDGIDFTSPFFVLNPNARAVIVKDIDAFTLRYGSDVDIIGQFTSGGLSNRGERLTLADGTGETIVDFEYGDDDPWPERADGAGGTVELIDPTGTPISQYGKHYRWRGSTEYGGSPGAEGQGPVGVVINEVLSHTDLPITQSDSIELLNTTDGAIDISGWFLSDTDNDLLKFEIPAETMLGAGEYLVFDEEDFNPSMGIDPDRLLKDFALNGAEGDDAWLVTSDGAGGVISIVDDVHFGASFNGETLGRVPNGSGRLAALNRNSLGCRNGQPRVGPLVITEINYNPQDDLSPDPNLVEDDLEFVEIHNPTSGEVNLTDWRLIGGVDFDFGDRTTIAASETLLAVSFDPNDGANADKLAAFRAHYGIGVGVHIVGGWNGQLSDSGEVVRLERPDDPPLDDPFLVPRVSEDEVLYDDIAPWPTNADGLGGSLSRTVPTSVGSSSLGWLAGTPTPGTVDFSAGVPGDFTGEGLVTADDIDVLYDAVNAASDVTFHDLDGSLTVDEGDVTHLVETILSTNFGDANLDGSVNGLDFNIWNAHRFQACTGWDQADFNGDGATDGSDFNRWNQHKFLAAAAAAEGQPSRTPRAPANMPVALSVDVIMAKTGANSRVQLMSRDKGLPIDSVADFDWSRRHVSIPQRGHARRLPSASARMADEELAVDLPQLEIVDDLFGGESDI